jgi:hypothetical protein
MPVIDNISVKLDSSEVLRRQGLNRNGAVRPEIEQIVHSLLATVESEELLSPAVSYEIFSDEEMDRRQRALSHSEQNDVRLLTALIPGAKEIVLAVCTIGPLLEKQVTDYSHKGEALRALLLDGIGSAAVDSLAIEAGKIVEKELSTRGYQLGRPVNPGMPCLPLTEQGWLLELVHAEDIGVSLTSIGLMVPRKSVSLVIGAGPEMQKWSPKDICAECSMNKACPYKYTHT